MADETDSQSPTPAGGTSSQWSFNWTGLAAIVAIGALIFIGWRWLAGSNDDSAGELSIVDTSEPTVTVETTTPRTTLPTTTVPPTPTTRPTTTTTEVPEARIVISGEMRPCRFGDNCLVANFTIEGFDEHPGRFTCIYPNSQRDFSFNDNDVDEACVTADQGDTITIDIDGLRSATISEENLDGTETTVP